MPDVNFLSTHFRLRERPFALLPDPDFLYWSRQHRRAYAVLEYGALGRASITVLTGQAGTGKTTLVQKLLRDIEDTVVVGLISNAQGGRSDLLEWALKALDVPHAPGQSYVAKHRTLQTFLIDKHAVGQRVVLIVDEAQNISEDGLEELRMMTHINAGKDDLLPLILVGQPELKDMIARYDLHPVAQPVTARFDLPNMDLDTTHAYIRHRLRHSGGRGTEFGHGAVALIHRYSEGVPRLVNKYADFAMVYAANAGRTDIDERTVFDVLADEVVLIPGPRIKEAAE